MAFLTGVMAWLGASSEAQIGEWPQEAVVIDVRTAGEFAEGHLPGAVHIDWFSPNFRAQVEALDKSKTYLLYCRSGNRSGQAVRAMQQMGFSQVQNLGSLQQAAALQQKCKTC